jgi:hypothetical protein
VTAHFCLASGCRFVSSTEPARHLYQQPHSNQFRKSGLKVRDFSFDKAVPKFAAAIEEQIDCDDASDRVVLLGLPQGEFATEYREI